MITRPGRWKSSLRGCAALALCAWASSGFGAPPIIFTTLDPVRADETLLLFGAHITPEASAQGVCLPNSTVTGPPAGITDTPAVPVETLKILQTTDLSAKVLIPKDWPPGVYAVRLCNADGAGAWQFANRPQLWWQMSGVGGKASPGEEVRIFGKNFGKGSRVWLTAQNFSRELLVQIAREYDVAAKLPADLPPGRYQLWLYNGHGGKAGFGEPLAIEVTPAEAWPTAVFDARMLGALGDGTTDDTEAIRRALKQARKAGGGVVYFPRGTYLIRGRLEVPPKTTLRGEAMAVVWLKVPPDAKPFDAVIVGNGQFAVEDLSIIGRPVDRLIASPDVPSTFTKGWARWHVSDPKPGQVILRRLRLQHLTFSLRLQDDDPRRQLQEGPTAVALRGPDCTVEDCKIVSSGHPIQISAATRARVSRNEFGTGRNGGNVFADLRDSVFEENEVLARDLEGTFGGVQGVATHVMFRDNNWHDAYGDEREGLTFDTPYSPVWLGRVKSAGARFTITKTEGGQWPPKTIGGDGEVGDEDLMAIVTGGAGLGQILPITGIEDTGLKLEKKPSVAILESSLVAIYPRKFQVIIAGNHFSDAAVSIQLYSQCNEFLIANNHAERTGGSYALGGDFVDQYQVRRMSALYFNQWIDNDFREGLIYEASPYPSAWLGYLGGRAEGMTDSTVALGNRFVGNRLGEGTFLGAKGRVALTKGRGSDVPAGRDAVLEHNQIHFSASGIEIDSGQWFCLVRGNSFSNVRWLYNVQGFGTKIIEETGAEKDTPQ